MIALTFFPPGYVTHKIGFAAWTKESGLGLWGRLYYCMQKLVQSVNYSCLLPASEQEIFHAYTKLYMIPTDMIPQCIYCATKRTSHPDNTYLHEEMEDYRRVQRVPRRGRGGENGEDKRGEGERIGEEGKNWRSREN